MSGSGSAGEVRRAQLDDLLVELLANGRTYAGAGESAGVSERTVRRRMSDPVFAGRVSRRRGEHVGALVGQLVDAGDEAVEVLRGSLHADTDAVRLRAAELVLRLGTQLRHGHELEARLIALETGPDPTPVSGADHD